MPHLTERDNKHLFDVLDRFERAPKFIRGGDRLVRHIKQLAEQYEEADYDAEARELESLTAKVHEMTNQQIRDVLDRLRNNGA